MMTLKEYFCKNLALKNVHCYYRATSNFMSRGNAIENASLLVFRMWYVGMLGI